MDERLKFGDVVKLDTDMWHQHGKYFLVHIAKYREQSTGIELTLEDKHGNIFTATLASNQIIKVS